MRVSFGQVRQKNAHVIMKSNPSKLPRRSSWASEYGSGPTQDMEAFASAGIRMTMPASRAASSRGGLAAARVERVTAFVEANIGESFRVGDLARVARLSTGHFSRAFKESFGETPLGYVNRRRVRHAQVIMLGSRDPLAKIALDCGMCDQSHLTRVFRRIVGINPAAWRRQFSTRG
jgi:AraC family transcriptional regulator